MDFQMQLHKITIFWLLIVTLTACTSPIEKERQIQQQRVARAETTLQQEQAYLQTLRDSLPIKIQQNIKLGIPPKQAAAVESALVKMQETVVNVATHNLHTQQSYLDSLLQYQP